MTQWLLGLAVGGIIICAIGLIVLILMRPQVNRIKSDEFSIEELTYSRFFKKIIDKILPDTSDKEYRQSERLISESGINISLRSLYFFKLVIPIGLFIICSSIYFMNKQIYVNAIISDSLVETVDVMGTSGGSKEITSKEKKQQEKTARDTYEVMAKLIDERMLKKEDNVKAKLSIQESIVNAGIATRENAAYMAIEVYDKMIRVENAKSIDIVTIVMLLLVSLAGFIIPNVFLGISKFMRYQAFDNEIIALEMLTILVGSVENITVKEILKILCDNSKAFKKYFEKALLEYPVDFEQALINLSESSKNKDFQALISTLRQCATSDKYAALQTLERRRISRKEYRKLMEEKKIETKMYVALALLMPVLFLLVKLLLSPWQNLMGTSGLF